MKSLKSQFPAAKDVHNLDAAATGLLPIAVIGAVNKYWTECGATAGRSPYWKSMSATRLVEESRQVVADWFNVSFEETVFTPGATHALNWIAKGIDFKPGDKVLVTLSDHHANIIPWMDLKAKGVDLVWAGCDRNGTIDIDDLRQKCAGCKVAAFSGASNVTGAIQPITELSAIARNNGTLSVIDAAQLAPHERIDFKSVGCDFMAVAGHKMMAPKGLGVLLGRKEAFSQLKPTIVGGGVVVNLTQDDYELMAKPLEYESGTQSLEGIIGFAEAIRWIKANNPEQIEKKLKAYDSKLCDFLKELKVEILHPEHSTPTISIIPGDKNPADIAKKLDETANIQVRSGFLCAMPFLKWVGADKGVLRISFGSWCDEDDLEAFYRCCDNILSS